MRTIIFFVVICGGGIVLQVFLSRSKRRWPGLILPGISFLFSLIAALSYAAYGTITSTTQNGETVTQRVQISAGDIVAIFITFLLSNIPTLILLAVYAAARGKQKKASELERMNVQELE